MKKIYFTLFILMMSIVFFQQAAAAGKTVGNITVDMTGFKNSAGQVDVALVNSKDAFDSDDVAPFMGTKVKIDGGHASCTFKDVPYGEYAIKFFHDKNEGGHLEYGAFGIPKEQYGFSNNARSKNYDKAKFTLGEPSMTITIKAR